MNQIIRIRHKFQNLIKEGYFIKTKKGLIPIIFHQGEFVVLKEENIIKQEEISINTMTGRIF